MGFFSRTGAAPPSRLPLAPSVPVAAQAAVQLPAPNDDQPPAAKPAPPTEGKPAGLERRRRSPSPAKKQQQQQQQQAGEEPGEELERPQAKNESLPSQKRRSSSYERLRVQVPGGAAGEDVPQSEQQQKQQQQQQEQLMHQAMRQQRQHQDKAPPEPMQQLPTKQPTTKSGLCHSSSDQPAAKHHAQPVQMQQQAPIHVPVASTDNTQSGPQMQVGPLKWGVMQLQQPAATVLPPTEKLVPSLAEANSLGSQAASRATVLPPRPPALLDLALFSRTPLLCSGADEAAQQQQQQQQQQPDLSWTPDQLLAECKARGRQLDLERRARQELEDMLLRLERHFKEETAAREAAEKAAGVARTAESDVRTALAMVNKQREEEATALSIEHETVLKERQALEEMRRAFDLEVHQARAEVAKAQEAVKVTEERVRATEAIERSRLATDYEAKLAAVVSEAERRDRERTHHAAVLQAEMLRWRQQAAAAAAAALEAKTAVIEGKREAEAFLGANSQRLDGVVERLYAGRDWGIDLQGSIGAYHRLLGSTAVGGSALVPTATNSGSLLLGRLPQLGSGAAITVGEVEGYGPVDVGGKQRASGGAGRGAARSGRGAGGWDSSSKVPARGSGGAAAATARRSSGGGGILPQLVAPAAAAAAASRRASGPPGGGSYAKLHATAGGATEALNASRQAKSQQQQQSEGPGAAAQYAQVPSRVFAAAAAYSATAGAEAKKRLEARQRAAGRAPDRFADTARTAGMVATSSRWH